MSEQNPSVVELQARWDKIRVANVYDTLDHMGYRQSVPRSGHQAALSPPASRGHGDHRARQRLSRAARRRRQRVGRQLFRRSCATMLYPGCVVVVESGGEPHAGKFGEMTSWALQQARRARDRPRTRSSATGSVWKSSPTTRPARAALRRLNRRSAGGSTRLERHHRDAWDAHQPRPRQPGRLDHRRSRRRDRRSKGDRDGSAAESREAWKQKNRGCARISQRACPSTMPTRSGDAPNAISHGTL